MRIQEVIRTINQMQSDGVIQRYAIGGAVGATFYLEPAATLDVDVFVAFKSDAGSPLISPKPIFDYLKERGCNMEGEYVMIAGWPVQFLPPTSPLVEEALEQAVERDVEGSIARVFTPEHLAAITLQTGRGKDMARLMDFMEFDEMNADRFEEIVKRHGLESALDRFHQQFGRGYA